jgi:acetate kinase
VTGDGRVDGPYVSILVLNPGSATLKATLLDPPERRPASERTVTWEVNAAPDPAADVAAAVDAAVEALPAGSTIEAVGYRVVHGGERFTGPTLVDDATVEAIVALGDLAPLHNPIAALTIRAGRHRLPDVPHVAVFDTAFHATLDEAAVRYPVPASWRTEAGIRRYGFHGLSVAWSVRRAAELLGTPVGALGLVVAHLGGGCSVTAVDGGRSVDTSMGMTPLEGLMMGTRAGSIDPGILIRRLRGGASLDELEADLEHRSGLLGVGGSADMERLLGLEAEGDGPATLALEMFVRRAAAGIGAATTHLATVDAIVFTGGIGQHATDVTQRIAQRLHPPAPIRPEHQDGDDRIGRSARGPAVLRIAAREDLVIAEAVRAALGDG